MKHLKKYKLFNEELYPFGTHMNSGKRLNFEELLEDSDFQDIKDFLIDEDGFEKFMSMFGSNDSLSYEIKNSTLLIYFLDKNILEDLLPVCKSLGADEITVQNDHIKCWFD